MALEAKTDIIETIEQSKSILAIGPGLSQHPETGRLVVHSLIRESETPTVIDADGINALSKSRENSFVAIASNGAHTPVSGEMARLIGGTVETLERDRDWNRPTICTNAQRDACPQRSTDSHRRRKRRGCGLIQLEMPVWQPAAWGMC